MDRLRLLVEGQTEETFANRTLLPHLYDFGFHDVSVTVVQTKRTAGGAKFLGGLGSWPQLLKDIRLLLADSGALVTTLIDYYGLPADVPGVQTVGALWDARKSVSHVEAAVRDAINQPNFVPHILLHEFEALLYTDPSAAGAHFADKGLAQSMEADLAVCGEPELVDDGPATAPSKRIRRYQPGYLKISDGPAILADIGLQAIRSTCPHFDAWLTLVESHAP